MKIRAVIMAGGSGTRFWPLSRRGRPKQLLPLASDRPLLADTVSRLRPLVKLSDVFITCGRLHAPAIRRMFPKLPQANLVVEPVGRNTGPCVALAAAIVARRMPRAILALLPADAYVSNARAFRNDLEAAAGAAAKGSLVTIGVRPTRPETGYGYIEVGEALDGGSVRKVARFVEKPNLARARRYLAGGRHLWNAGIFVFRADAMLREVDLHLPSMGRGVREIARFHGTPRFDSAMRRIFPSLESVSIDYGVMEKAGDVAVVPATFRWSDLGSFAALPEVRPLDRQGNLVAGAGAMAFDSRRCVVLAGGRPLAVVGASDLVVVDAGDAVLVCGRDKCQDVRKVVEELQRRKANEHL